jgi:hypothetical protein
MKVSHGVSVREDLPFRTSASRKTVADRTNGAYGNASQA